MTLRPISLVLVAIQAGALLYLAATGPWFTTPRWIGLEIAGLFLGVLAVLYLRPRQFRVVLPEPARDTALVTRGPYRFLRHPLYTAVLLISLAVVLERPTAGRSLAWLVLLADLVVKARSEESLLRRRFPDYAAYQRRTKRFLPGIY